MGWQRLLLLCNAGDSIASLRSKIVWPTPQGGSRLRSLPPLCEHSSAFVSEVTLLVDLEGLSAWGGSCSTALMHTSFSSYNETKELPTLLSAMDAVTPSQQLVLQKSFLVVITMSVWVWGWFVCFFFFSWYVECKKGELEGRKIKKLTQYFCCMFSKLNFFV